MNSKSDIVEKETKLNEIDDKLVTALYDAQKENVSKQMVVFVSRSGSL